VVAGSDPACPVCLPDLSVNKRHCQFRLRAGSVDVQTLDFATGTWVNNSPIEDIVALKEGDALGVGDLAFKVSLESVAEPIPAIPAAETRAPGEPPVTADSAGTAPEAAPEAAPAAPSGQPNAGSGSHPRPPGKPPSYGRSPYMRPGSVSRAAVTSRFRQAASAASPPASPTSPAPAPEPAPAPAPPAPVAKPVPPVPESPPPPPPAIPEEHPTTDPHVAALKAAWPQYAARHEAAALAKMVAQGREQARHLGFGNPEEVDQFLQCVLLCNDELTGPNQHNMDVWLTLTLQGKPAAMRLRRALSIAQRLAESRYGGGTASQVRPPAPTPAGAPPATTPASPAPRAPAPAADGSRPPAIEGFTMGPCISHGPMGDVYQAHDDVLDMQVAIKFLHGMQQQASADRFLAEARAAAKVQHPNIVPVQRFGRTDHGCYYVMPLIKGMDVGQLIAEFRKAEVLTRSGTDILRIAGVETAAAPAEVQQAAGQAQPYAALIAAWLSAAAEGVGSAHRVGVIHRDIKPGNLMLSADGRMMVCDFGLAVRFDERFAAGCVGTPQYLSPEMLAAWAVGAAGTNLDERMDIWGLGLTLLELLVLRPIYEGPTVEHILRDIATIDPPPARQLNPGVPEALEAICARACARNPSQRYGSAAELAAELRAFATGTGAPPPENPAEGAGSGLLGWLRKK
jgi:hypothetical protein